MTLRSDRRAAVGLELALVFPVVLLFIFGMVAAYDLVMAKRAMDVGVQKALRYAIVNAGASESDIRSVYTTWANLISTRVATNSTVAITPAPAGAKATVSASYPWLPPTTLAGITANPIFTGVTLTATGTMRVMH